MRMLKEDNEREKAKRQNVAASAESTSAHLIAERDAALSEVHDLKQQLAAALADVDVCKSDMERITIGNNNLQSALEAFQMEREAELAIWEENKQADEKALQAAHEAKLEATRQVNEAQMQLIQNAADAAVRNTMTDIKLLEEKVEMYRTENFQMRRSLDEAISRLQATQDDVIDRSFMKNVLFDWLTKKGAKERRDVLEVMANILHFTEEEKEKVHISHSSIGISRIVGTLPEPKADMEHLEGENVREKWVNFLLAETND
jgi:GRIP domain/GRAB domain